MSISGRTDAPQNPHTRKKGIWNTKVQYCFVGQGFGRECINNVCSGDDAFPQRLKRNMRLEKQYFSYMKQMMMMVCIVEGCKHKNVGE